LLCNFSLLSLYLLVFQKKEKEKAHQGQGTYILYAVIGLD
jgi:hypothetical protein